MPVSSLVVTFDSDPGLRAHAHKWLCAASGISTGELQGQRLPVVLETATLSEGRLRVEEMQRVRGIRFVSVLSINFEDGDF